MYTISKNKPRKNKIFKRKEKKTGGGPGKKGLDKIWQHNYGNADAAKLAKLVQS